MNWYISVMKNYGNFNGRARRKEYWMFQLVNIPVGSVAYYLAFLNRSSNEVVIFISLIFLLTVWLIPTLAVTVRRIHDLELSGFWIFIGSVPFVGQLILFYLTICHGTVGENKYGPDPKAIGKSKRAGKSKKSKKSVA